MTAASRCLLVVAGAAICAASPRPKHVNVRVNDADIRSVVTFLADVVGANVVIASAVQGRVTLRLRNVPWLVALDAILKSGGYAADTSGDVILVDTSEAILARAERRVRVAETDRQLGRLVTVVVPIDYARASALQPIVASMLSPRGSVFVDERTNVLIITDIETEVDHVRRQLGR